VAAGFSVWGSLGISVPEWRGVHGISRFLGCRGLEVYNALLYILSGEYDEAGC
jgi:hypothetical protein